MSDNLPAYLRKFMPEAGAPSADVASLATAQNSTPRISLRGRMFRFMVGGEETKKSSGPIEGFIVGVEPGPGKFTKAWYEKAYGGSAESNSPPDCSSTDGVHPDGWVSKRQHSECATCPKNQYGSATSRKGKPSKACADSKRIWWAEDADKESPLYVLGVPVSSLRALAEYGRKLADMGVEPWMPKTAIEMVDAEYPELRFSVAGFIDEPDIPGMKERAAKKEWTQGRLALANPTPAPIALPPHIAAQMGQGAAAPEAGVTDVEARPAAGAVGAAPSNGDILKNW